MNLTYHKTGTLIKQKFKEFFTPTVLSSMVAQRGTIINGIIVSDGANYIFTTIVAVSVFIGVLWAFLLIANGYALSIFLSFAEDLRALLYKYLIGE